MWEAWVQSLGWEDPLEKGRATHSSTLAWRISWTIQYMGLQTARHNWETFTFTFSYSLVSNSAFTMCWGPPGLISISSLHTRCGSATLFYFAVCAFTLIPLFFLLFFFFFSLSLSPLLFFPTLSSSIIIMIILIFIGRLFSLQIHLCHSLLHYSKLLFPLGFCCKLFIPLWCNCFIS